MENPLEIKGTVEFFQHHVYFSRFAQEEREYLAKLCNRKIVKKNESVFNENDIGKSGFVVRSGGVKIFKAGFLGEETIVQLTQGELFGEMALLDASPRSASAKAMDETVLIELTSDAYESLKREKPEIAVKLMDIFLKLLTTRLRNTTLKLFAQF